MSAKFDIDYLLEEVVTLPSLPSTVAQITELLNDPDCSLAEVSRAISADPSIALKSLRLVNSAYYGFRDRVNSVDHAVVLLGMKVVKNLAFTAAVFDTLQAGEETLVRHNVTCAMIMRRLVESNAAPKVAFADPEEAFIFGLLHDVGKIIFHQYVPDEFGEVLAVCTASDKPWAEAEREIIGADHAEVGARLAEKWKLSAALTQAIAGHHDLDRCEDEQSKSFASLVAVADYISYACGHPGHVGAKVTLDPRVWEYTGITSTSVLPAVDKFLDSSTDIDELVEMVA